MWGHFKKTSGINSATFAGTTAITSMQQRLFFYKHSPVSYYRFGHGGKVLVAFHGYNQSGQNYGYFENVFEDQFTVIAIDFFWHGASEWKEKADFTEQDMKNIVLGISKQEAIIATSFSICSFSMGARMARALVRTFPEQIEQLILLSPPAFSFNRFLNFVTGNVFGLSLFRYFVQNHGALLRWMERLNKWHVMNRSVYVFSSRFAGSPERLEKVYRTWYAQRRLLTSFNTFAKLVNEHGIRVVLIVGKQDYITPPYKMIRYVRGLKNGKVFMVRKKHELATPETKMIFKELFGDPV